MTTETNDAGTPVRRYDYALCEESQLQGRVPPALDGPLTKSPIEPSSSFLVFYAPATPQNHYHPLTRPTFTHGSATPSLKQSPEPRMAAAPPTASAAPASAPAPPRVIPGLASGTQRSVPAAAKRSRKKKAPVAGAGVDGTAGGITDDVAIAAALRETAPTPGGALADEVSAGLGLGVELPSAAPAGTTTAGNANLPPVASAADIAKPVSPVQQVIKRIKALKKKIVRREACPWIISLCSGI